jgi:threonine dehydratase
LRAGDAASGIPRLLRRPPRPTLGAITFAIDRRELAGVVAVDDDAVLEAMALAAEHLKVVVEPSGAAALAALLRSPPQRCVAVILSGGNVDAELLSNAVTPRENLTTRRNQPMSSRLRCEGKVRQHLCDGP